MDVAQIPIPWIPVYQQHRDPCFLSTSKGMRTRSKVICTSTLVHAMSPKYLVTFPTMHSIRNLQYGPDPQMSSLKMAIRF